jgi:hypothetical protein
MPRTNQVLASRHGRENDGVRGACESHWASFRITASGDARAERWKTFRTMVLIRNSAR